ncbi:hypothetical protein Tfu_0296 [Thermobifida fusca YX]|uniref:Uncharacterized protein n=1 Tax=Thermobifida fusca (strain YX) TaxID=269800 RepID=Q47T83_THEFY|nr:hypothetical protein Tfu_0296 [Thermobifida fusca YX]
MTRRPLCSEGQCREERREGRRHGTRNSSVPPRTSATGGSGTGDRAPAETPRVRTRNPRSAPGDAAARLPTSLSCGGSPRKIPPLGVLRHGSGAGRKSCPKRGEPPCVDGHHTRRRETSGQQSPLRFPSMRTETHRQRGDSGGRGDGRFV